MGLIAPVFLQRRIVLGSRSEIASVKDQGPKVPLMGSVVGNLESYEHTVRVWGNQVDRVVKKTPEISQSSQTAVEIINEDISKFPILNPLLIQAEGFSNFSKGRITISELEIKKILDLMKLNISSERKVELYKNFFEISVLHELMHTWDVSTGVVIQHLPKNNELVKLLKQRMEAVDLTQLVVKDLATIPNTNDEYINKCAIFQLAAEATNPNNSISTESVYAYGPVTLLTFLDKSLYTQAEIRLKNPSTPVSNLDDDRKIWLAAGWAGAEVLADMGAIYLYSNSRNDNKPGVIANSINPSAVSYVTEVIRLLGMAEKKTAIKMCVDSVCGSENQYTSEIAERVWKAIHIV